MDDPNNSRHEEISIHAGPPGYGWTAHLPPISDDLPLQTDPQEMKRLFSLLDHIKSGSEIKRIAEEFLTHSASRLHSLTAAILPLIHPSRYRWRERQVAIWILGRAHLEPEQREFAIKTLIRILERKLEIDRSYRLKQTFLRAVPLALFISLPLHSTSGGDPPYPAIVLMMQCLLFPLFFIGVSARDSVASSHIYAEAAGSLGKMRATESLDVLVAATQKFDTTRNKNAWHVRLAAADALPPVLGTLTTDHYGQISSETMQALCRLLTAGSETLTIAILNAFIYIGNSQVISAVEKLAAGGGRAAREPRVQQAAQRCLPVIQTRVARENDPHILLRAAVIPPTPSDQLLRPIRESEPVDPMELLRSSTAPDWKGSPEEVELILQILDHLQQRGDARALPYVEQIAAAQSIDARILAAAKACLPVLRAHIELERYSPSQDNVIVREVRN